MFGDGSEALFDVVDLAPIAKLVGYKLRALNHDACKDNDMQSRLQGQSRPTFRQRNFRRGTGVEVDVGIGKDGGHEKARARMCLRFRPEVILN